MNFCEYDSAHFYGVSTAICTSVAVRRVDNLVLTKNKMGIRHKYSVKYFSSYVRIVVS